MRVGILTYHNAINYGAVLQAYALQQVLRNIGIDSEIINYSCPAVEKQYRRKKFSDHAYWKVYMEDLLSIRRIERKKVEFQKFVRDYCILSENVNKGEYDLFNKYDSVIVGSDQVFNPKNTEGDSIYLLDFECSAKKIAYAASIGNNSFLKLWKEIYNVDYEVLLKKFDRLSFREEEAAAFVSDFLKGSYSTVLDPVLLAGMDLWCNFQEVTNDEYIFVYNLGNIPFLFECTKRISKETGLKVRTVNKSVKGDYIFHSFENVSSLSPADFLKMLSGAKYVITDSFHGTAFSILFHKNFTSILDSHKVNTNSRILDLLKKVNLEDRIATNFKELNRGEISTYFEVDKNIAEMQKNSLEWLKEALVRKG